jgi:hypothetical protein
MVLDAFWQRVDFPQPSVSLGACIDDVFRDADYLELKRLSQKEAGALVSVAANASCIEPTRDEEPGEGWEGIVKKLCTSELCCIQERLGNIEYEPGGSPDKWAVPLEPMPDSKPLFLSGIDQSVCKKGDVVFVQVYSNNMRTEEVCIRAEDTLGSLCRLIDCYSERIASLEMDGGHSSGMFHLSSGDLRICEGQESEMKIRDLVRISQHCFFTHYGDCRHLIVFTQMRTIHEALDAFLPRAFIPRKRERVCVLCDKRPATFVTLYDRYAPEDPCFYCEGCYLNFHYDASGQLLYDSFEVYRFIQ